MIKRNKLSKIEQHISEKEITLILGPRQVGKTTIMKILQRKLESQGENTLYINLDFEKDFSILKSQIELLNYLELELGTKQKAYVFIDEIQRKENAGLFLKGLYDMDLPYKFIVSGSGSVELKEKVSEGLAGRKKSFHLYPLSFEEFLNFKTNYKYEGRLVEYFSVNSSELLLEEYLKFGGYPEVVKHERLEDKRDVLESIWESFIDRDIKSLLGIDDTDVIYDLMALLSVKIGKITTLSEVASVLSIDTRTLKKYLYYLEQTFMISKAKPFFTNKEKEFVKSPTYYFIDLGMRNFVFNRLSHYNRAISGGMLFQNFVFLKLLRDKFITKINYWRTVGGAEVDFIAHMGSKRFPIEVKFKNFEKVRLKKSFHSYIDTYQPDRAFLYNLNLDEKLKVEGTEVQFLPYYRKIELVEDKDYPLVC